ncbi:MAG: hypothetical protein WBV46_16205, partial [Terriglobales bacterium]
MQDRADELHFLLHAFRKLFHFLVNLVGQFQTLAPILRALLRLAAGQAFELREKDEVSQHLHLFVESALFGEIAEVASLAAAQRFSQHQNLARIGDDDADDHPQRTGFAGAVGAEQAVNCGWLDA